MDLLDLPKWWMVSIALLLPTLLLRLGYRWLLSLQNFNTFSISSSQCANVSFWGFHPSIPHPILFPSLFLHPIFLFQFSWLLSNGSYVRNCCLLSLILLKLIWVREFHQGNHQLFVETYSSWVMEFLGLFEVLGVSEDVAIEVCGGGFC